MIYLVTNQKKISSEFQLSSVEESLEYLNKLEWIGTDTETTGFDPHTDQILTLQLGDFNTQYYIDASVDFKLYKNLLENKKLIIQNAQFDNRFFYRLGIYPLKLWDTFITEVCITLGNDYSPKDLGAIADKYVGENNHDVDKSKRGLVHKLDVHNSTVVQYGCNDVKYLELIKNAQYKVCEELGILESVIRECEFTPALAYIAYCGIHVDTDKWLSKVKESKKKLDLAYKALDDWYINNPKMNKTSDGQMLMFTDELCPVKWSSSDQVIPILEMEGVDVWTVEKGEKKKTSGEKHLQRYKGKFEIVDLLLEYRHWQTDISKYGEQFLRFINKNTGRIHTTFRQVLLTGRISSGKRKKGKTDEEAYPNLQNIPKEDNTRRCFTPQFSHNSVCYCDYSQQEDVVFVNFSKELKLIDFYRRPGKNDGHSFVAKMTFKDQLKDVDEHDIKEVAPVLRDQAKKVKFSIHYGGDGSTIAENVHISLKEGKELYESYLTAFPGIANYFDKCNKEAVKKKYILVSPITGRKIFLNDLSKDIIGFKSKYFESLDHWKQQGKLLNNTFWNKWREEKKADSKWYKQKKDKVREYFRIRSEIRKKALNAPIQGSSAEITKKAATRLFHWIIENNYQNIILMINMIHDEIGTEQPKTLEQEVASKLQYFMEDSAKEYCTIIPLKADPVITDHWTH